MEFVEDLLPQVPEENEGEHEQESCDQEPIMKEAQLQHSIVLSGQPVSKWTSLVYLDLIKERNKPIEPPKEPEAAPFFLSTLPGLNPVFTAEKKDDQESAPSILFLMLLILNSFSHRPERQGGEPHIE